MTPTVQRVDHIHVYVRDRAQAERWYAEVLGFHRMKGLEFWAAEGGPLTISDESGSIHLALFEQPRQACRSTVAFAANASQFLAWWRHLAVALKQPMQPVDHQVAWSLYFSDPDGNPFEITCYDYDLLSAKLKNTQPASG
ncbi:MAG TPA: VOC family protein [Burkholderiaceae bacterium]|jgi:catechol-2,3-dioxygenase|nr:VOC family protein [Burkholderiaceae bacterium]